MTAMQSEATSTGQLKKIEDLLCRNNRLRHSHSPGPKSLYDALSDEAEWVIKRVRELEGALQKIQKDEGQVCDSYEVCVHKGCESSYASWLVAFKALKGEVVEKREVATGKIQP